MVYVKNGFLVVVVYNENFSNDETPVYTEIFINIQMIVSINPWDGAPKEQCEINVANIEEPYLAGCSMAKVKHALCLIEETEEEKHTREMLISSTLKYFKDNKFDDE